MSDIHHVYLVSRSKSGGKFWELEVEGKEMRTRYGKLGQEKSWSSKTFDSHEKAMAEGEKKANAKRRKGYVEELGSWDMASRIDGLVSGLESSSHIKLLKLERGEPLTDKQLADVEASIGYALDPRFLEFFRACNGLRVLWVTKYADDQDSPESTYLYALDDGYTCGSINVPPLAELFGDPGYLFGVDFQGPGEYQEDALGGWDAYALRSAMRNIDDWRETPNDSSYYLPALIQDARFPDPPVLMTSDYAAAASDNHPMLARHYLQLIVATAGAQTYRMRCMSSRGFSKNHMLFLPPDNWLDGFPTTTELIDFQTGNGGNLQAQLDLIAGMGGSTKGTEYACYNEAPPAPKKVPTDDPNAGMRTRTRGDGGVDFPEGFDGDTMTLALLAAIHYDAPNPIAEPTAEKLKPLLGEPVRVKEAVFGDEVGCLVAVGEDSITLYSEFGADGSGGHGTSSMSISGLSLIGRAYQLVDA